jgi:tetratricopeptide (TPR) repeat protein
MNIRHGLAAALLALLAAPPSATAAAAESWRMVTTPHFRVLSQVNDRETAKWIRDYQQFISATSDALSIKPRALPPLTVILFARDRSFTPYKLMRPDGKVAKVAGQFVTFGGISTIGLALDSEQAETRRTIFHEATHWLTSADPERIPTWFSEGIAEMLSTFEQTGGKVNWAKPIDVHLVQMSDYGVLPLKEFLTRVDSLQDQDKHDDRYYSQSWAFVHFLMLSGDKSRPDLLTRFLTLYKTMSGDDTVREVFGDKLADLERDFNHYVRKATYSYYTLPAKPVEEPPAAVPAPPAIVEAALGLMALGTGRKDMAQQHAQRAAELGPDLPDGHALLAYLARENKDYIGVGKHAKAALNTGSNDAEIFLLMADALAANSNGNYQETRSERLRLYRQAIELSPTRREIYEQLAGDLMFVSKPEPDDERLLQQGLRLFPNDWIKVGAAMVSTRRGSGNDALAVTQAALRPDSKLTAEQRKIVGTARRNMVMQAMDAELATAQERKDMAGARAIIARYRPLVGDDAEDLAYLQRRDSQYEMSQLIERMNAALSRRRADELNPLFDQILAHPAVTSQLREFVENTRRNLK